EPYPVPFPSPYTTLFRSSGFVLGNIATLPAPSAPGLWLRYRSAIEGLREAIDDRIRAVLTGDTGAIASALITGKRDAITPAVSRSEEHTSELQSRDNRVC